MMQNVLKMKRQRTLEEQQKQRKNQRRSPTTQQRKKERNEKNIEDRYIEQLLQQRLAAMQIA